MYHFCSVSRHQIAEISSVEVLSWANSSLSWFMNESPSLVAGFKQADFLIHSLTDKCELLRLSCGGWRRPHSFFLEAASARGFKFTFAFYREQRLTVCYRLKNQLNSKVSHRSCLPQEKHTFNTWFHGCDPMPSPEMYFTQSGITVSASQRFVSLMTHPFVSTCMYTIAIHSHHLTVFFDTLNVSRLKHQSRDTYNMCCASACSLFRHIVSTAVGLTNRF